MVKDGSDDCRREDGGGGNTELEAKKEKGQRWHIYCRLSFIPLHWIGEKWITGTCLGLRTQKQRGVSGPDRSSLTGHREVTGRWAWSWVERGTWRHLLQS